MCNNVRFLCQVCWMKKKINIISNYYHSALVDFGEHAALNDFFSFIHVVLASYLAKLSSAINKLYKVKHHIECLT